VASLTITTRRTASGPRFVVRYRLGGRAYPVEHGGSFKTMREAKARRDLIGGELAAGRNPRVALEALTAAPTRRTFGDWAEAYQASRVDLSANARKNIASHLPRILTGFGDRDPRTITTADVQEWVAANGDLNPSSLRRYTATLRQLLDFAEVEPNPARDKRVKLPRVVSEEVEPPTASQTLAILERVGPRWLLPLVVLEATAMRVGELARLAWGDVDVAESRFRLPRRSTKSRRPRWVQVPAWLTEAIAATCPLEDRTAELQVFPRFTVDGAEKAMRAACKLAEIPRFSPHDLRHRRLSLWHGQGVPAKELAERAGHARASMSLDVYSHVMPLDELPQESLEALLVWSPCGLDEAERA
jgi:integrase